ncbi:1-deoxy-D-xylulose-5-phosphate reductoisomerase, partial [Kingella kingae]
MQTLTILGSTGSIGVSTLDVVSRHPDKFQIFALAGHSQVEKLAEQCRQFAPKYAVVADENRANELRQQLGSLHTKVLFSKQALIDIATAPEVTGVMCAIVGAAGLPSALAAAQHGKTIYLANKETLVVSGSLFMETAKKHGAKVLPIDSEHNAIFQVLPRDYADNMDAHGVTSIILTASGGSFLNTPLADMPHITPAQAVKHPNWSMGQKISVDSSTMMNKGLELIEAHWLFNCPPDKLEVVIHPQSIIHSMVRYADGSVLAQLGNPDMRTPIAYCLGLP